MGVFAFHWVWNMMQLGLGQDAGLVEGVEPVLGAKRQAMGGWAGGLRSLHYSFLLTWSLVLQAVDITEIPRKAPDGPFLLQNPSQSSKVSLPSLSSAWGMKI